MCYKKEQGVLTISGIALVIPTLIYIVENGRNQ